MKAIKRAIILCWIMLIVCFIIKLFGGNWFEIICNNEHFIRIGKYIDEHLILKYCIAFPFYIVPAYFVLSTCCLLVKPNWKQVLAILCLSTSVWFTQFISQEVKTICEIAMFVVIPYIMILLSNDRSNWKEQIKRTWYGGILACTLYITFQVLSFVTRNIGIVIVDDNILITIILMIDYYIMIALYCLYVRLKLKKEKEKE